jgi:hypothetical protein
MKLLLLTCTQFKVEPNLTGINQRLGYVLRKRSESRLDSTIETYIVKRLGYSPEEIYHKLAQGLRLDGASFYQFRQ